MQRLFFFAACFLLLLVSSGTAQDPPQEGDFELRTWTSTTDKKVRATFVGISKEGVVTLRSEDGSKTMEVPLNKLSTADKTYLRNKRIEFVEKVKSDKVESEKQLEESGVIVSLYDKDAEPVPAGFSKMYRSPFTAARSVAYRMDGRQILVWGHNNEALLWNNATGRKVKMFKGNTSGAEVVAFSGDGRLNVSSCEGTKVALRDTLTGKILNVFEGHTGIVTPVAVSADGKWALSGSADKTAILWNIETGKMAHRLTGHPGRILSVAFHPDREYCLTGDDEGTAIYWNIDSGSQSKRIDNVGGPLNSVSFNQDGVIAMLIAPGIATLWDTYVLPKVQASSTAGGSTERPPNPVIGKLTTLPLIVANDPQVRDGMFDSVAFSKDNSYFMLVSKIGNVYFGDLKTQRWIRRIDQLASGVNRAAFNPDGKEYLTVSFNDGAIFWDNETGEKTEEFNGFNYCVNPIRMTDDGNRILTSGGWCDPTIAVWDTKSGKLLKRLEGHKAAVRHIQVLPNGKRILSASFEKFDDQKHEFNAPDTQPRRNPDRQVILWDISTGKALVDVPDAIGWALAPNGSQLITATGDEKRTPAQTVVTFWDTLTGRKVRETKGADVGDDFIFYPDGNRILAKRGDAPFNWVARTGKEAGIFRNMKYDVWTSTIAPGGKLLLTGTGDGSAILWNLLKDAPETNFGGHGGAVISTAISPDGKYVLTGSTDKTAVLWNAEDGKQIKKLTAGEGPIVGVGFTADGKLMMAGSEDGTVTFHAM